MDGNRSVVFPGGIRASRGSGLCVLFLLPLFAGPDQTSLRLVSEEQGETKKTTASTDPFFSSSSYGYPPDHVTEIRTYVARSHNVEKICSGAFWLCPPSLRYFLAPPLLRSSSTLPSPPFFPKARRESPPRTDQLPS
ncbi:hypothetical protein GGR56DRAFT_308673 [Xylariaceae sp. FL0804]|nr:hypothetical protein GGR56DRAFT_308673 [Xylariaceae sp. FL0804]